LERVERIDPVPPPTPLRLCPHHKIFGFREAATRDLSLSVLTSLLADQTLTEYVLLKLDIKQPRWLGTADYVLYLIVTEFDENERATARIRLKGQGWHDELNESSRYLEEQLSLAELSLRLFDSCDDREIGYPEKLSGMLNGWTVLEIFRGGSRLQSQAVLSDWELLRLARGLGGYNAHTYEMVGTPRRALSWSEAREQAEYCLRGNSAWQAGFRAYFDEIERNWPAAVVTARVYNPCNLLIGLYRLSKFGAAEYLPAAEMVVSSASGEVVRLIRGLLVWDGTQVTDLGHLLPPEIPTLFDLFFATAVEGGPWALEDDLLARHGLSCVLVEGEPNAEGIEWAQLCFENGVIRRTSWNDRQVESFHRFCEAHLSYFTKLIADFDSWAAFI
jgi:hypothetical protein